MLCTSSRRMIVLHHSSVTKYSCVSLFRLAPTMFYIFAVVATVTAVVLAVANTAKVKIILHFTDTVQQSSYFQK